MIRPAGLGLLSGRMERCRRLLVVAGPGLFGGPVADDRRAGEILRELERYYEGFLLLAESGSAQLREAGLQSWLEAAPEPSDDTRLSEFQLHRPQLCLLVGARCASPLAAGAVAAAWRSSTWIAELGAEPSELAVLAKEDLWEHFLCGELPGSRRD